MRWAALLVVLLAPAVAQADDPAARADALFTDARRLVAEGRAPEACPMFATSQALDPKPGTLLNLADCYERVGKFASAWSAFREGEKLARDRPERLGAIRERIAKLELTLHRVAIDFDAAPPGARVQRDGAEVAATELGVLVPLDPGAHRIDVMAPGRAPQAQTFDVPSHAGVMRIRIPALPLAATSLQTREPERASTEPAHGLRVAAIASFAGAALATAGALVLGAIASSTHDDASARCSDTAARRCADGEAVDLADRALTQATWATVAGVGAGVLAAAGVTFIVLDARASRSVRVGPGIIQAAVTF